MTWNSLIKNSLYVLFALILSACSKNVAIIYDLQCENLSDPLGIDNTSPHLSWKIKSESNNTTQQAFQILAASEQSLLSEGKADLWDSGKTESTESVWVDYSGKSLAPNSFIYWKVRVWDEDGNSSDWSTTAYFSIGLLEEKDWTASYIGTGLITEEDTSPLFRKSFEWTGRGEKAILHVNSLGYHEVYLNGKKVGDKVLTPAVSQFNKRSLSIAYDLSDELIQGNNELVLWLSRGWYRDGLPGVVAGGPFVRAQLMTEVDGIWNSLVSTNNTWLTRKSGRSTTGSWRPHQFGGEVVNAMKVLPDLTATSLNSVNWDQVQEAGGFEPSVTPQMTEPNRILKSIHPVEIKSLNDTTWFVDMGTNLTGWTEIKFPQLQAEQKVTISYCDFLDKDGNFIDGRKLTDYYIASGRKDEVFCNKFNYHAYRYIKISNLTESPKQNDITAHLIHTDFKGNSSFSCSDKDMNDVHEMIHYTLKCISLGGYMVDCPHIERLGYGGDGNASTLTAQTMYNMGPLYLNWMSAWADCMREDGSMPHTAPNPYSAGGGPYWCGFIITASWETYVNYGDDRLLKRFYPYMKKWLDYVEAYSVNGLLDRWPNTDYRNWYLGDWATPEGIDQTDNISIGLVANCYVSQCYETMAKIAKLFGEESDKQVFLKKAQELKELVHSKFYNQELKTYSTGTQIDLIYPMLAEVTPDVLIEEVKNTLYRETESRFKGHLATGLVGVPIITEWATMNGEADFMYNMLKKREYPGYLYMLDNGATTTWEHWNGDRSHIHNCYNGIGSWFYQALGGILPDEDNPGYRHIFIKPQLVNGIDWVKATKDTPYGQLSSSWKIENSRFTLDIEIPVGSSASVTLPKNSKNITLNNQKTDNQGEIKIQSGIHQIICDL